MITDVYIVHNDSSFIENFGDTLKVSPFFHFIDENTKDGKKEAYTLKSHWGAKLTPFAICFERDKALKAFYSESESDVIKSLINYLNESENQI